MERRVAQPLSFRLAAAARLAKTRSPLGAPLQRRYGAGPRFLTNRFASPPARRLWALSGGHRLLNLGQA
jgi:hypothetical protein